MKELSKLSLSVSRLNNLSMITTKSIWERATHKIRQSLLNSPKIPERLKRRCEVARFTCELFHETVPKEIDKKYAQIKEQIDEYMAAEDLVKFMHAQKYEWRIRVSISVPRRC